MTGPSEATKSRVRPEPVARGRLARWLNPHGWGPRRLCLQIVLSIALALFLMDWLAHQLFWPEPGATEVLLVSSERCPHSRAVRAHLVANEIPFRELDSRRDPLASGLAGWAFQSVSVPIVVVGTEIIHGNRAQQIDAALGELGYPADRDASIP